MPKTSFDEIDSTGEFKRKPTTFRHAISKDGQFPPEKDRYHLYVCYACPWASRCLAVLELKGLTDVIAVHTVHPVWGTISETGDKSWVFGENGEKFGDVDVSEPLYGLRNMRELYEKDTPDYDFKYTVPVLWDAKHEKIVNNESSEILRFLNNEFNDFAKYPELDLTPKDKLEKIDEINAFFYNTVNNGVYRCGFAQSQSAYETAFHQLFATLDQLEERLEHTRFLLGPDEPLTECDIRLVVTTLRFDRVYATHFKCNKRLMASYPNISNWMRDVYQTGTFKESVKIDHIAHHYYRSHPQINPYGIVPLGFTCEDFNAPHDRASRSFDGKVPELKPIEA